MRKILLLALVGAMTACTSYESARTTHNVREYLTEDIEEQIVFNLIRAANGLPFAHYDVVSAQSIVTAKGSVSAGGIRTGVSNGYRPMALVTSAVRTITRNLTGSIGGERSNGVTVNVKPIFDDPKLYAKYIKFLNLAPKTWSKEASTQFNEFDTNEQVDTAAVAGKKAEGAPPLGVVAKVTKQTIETGKDEQPIAKKSETTTESRPIPTPTPTAMRFPTVHFGHFHSLQVSDHKPPKAAYIPHTLRSWDGRWYYIPLDYQQEFSNFCLSLIARAGDTGVTGEARSEERKTRAFEDLSSEIMKQNTLIQGQ